MSDLVLEKELRLRQAMTAVGMKDLAYWLSWHAFQTLLTALQSLLVCGFGRAFNFALFTSNDIGVCIITLWLFCQAMSAAGFLLGAFLPRSTQAIPAGFASFLISFGLFFVIAIFRFPYGGLDNTPPYA